MPIDRLAILVLVTNEKLHLDRFMSQFTSGSFEIYIIDGFSDDGSIEPYLNSPNIHVLRNRFETQAQQFSWALNQLDPNVDWILRLDADELIDRDKLESIWKSLVREDRYRGAHFSRKIKFQGKLLRFGGSGENRCLRLFRRNYAYSDKALMDEKIKVSGECFCSNLEIIDDSKISLSQWIEKHNNYSSREALITLVDKYPDLKCFYEDYDFKRSGIKYFYYLFPPYLRVILLFIYRLIIKGGVLDGSKGIQFLFLQCFFYRWIVDSKISEGKTLLEKESKLTPEVHKALLKSLKLEMRC